MDCTSYPSFSDEVKRLGPKKLLYPVKDVSSVLGISESVIRNEIHAGRMKFCKPDGKREGYYLRPEWVDEWIEAGTHA